MTESPAIITGLSDIAGSYDVLICDVWGVLHNGVRAYDRAADALRRYRVRFGPVVLLSNAPRPVSVVEDQFERFGVPKDCYDAIVTSGVATREALARRTAAGRLPIFHLGPERDRGVFDGLPVDCVDPERAELVLCTGPFDDDVDTPEDYRELLALFRARGLRFLCANPDIVVQRGGELIYCAGAIARLYEEIGGEVVYYGKPHLPIYKLVLDRAANLAGRAVARPLAIGDGLKTDILGAARAGIDALFVAGGIHTSELGTFSQSGLAELFAKEEAGARYALPQLVW